MLRVLLILVILQCALLVTPVSALAAPQDIKLYPKAPVTVSVGSPIEAKLNVRERFSAVTLVCVEFQFEGDLLDPGEAIAIELGPSFGGFGFVNLGSTPLNARAACTAQPEALDAFLDGRQAFEIRMESGSVTIASVTTTVVGS